MVWAQKTYLLSLSCSCFWEPFLLLGGFWTEQKQNHASFHLCANTTKKLEVAGREPTDTKKDVTATWTGKKTQILSTSQPLDQSTSLYPAEVTLTQAWGEQCIFSSCNLSSKSSADLTNNTIRGLNTVICQELCLILYTYHIIWGSQYDPNLVFLLSSKVIQKKTIM